MCFLFSGRIESCNLIAHIIKGVIILENERDLHIYKERYLCEQMK